MDSKSNVQVAMKTVTVFNTMGKNAQDFQTSAKTWAELQKNLAEVSISYSGMKAVIGETRLTVESPNAILPEGNFTLYLMPVKTKSGADRKQLFDDIKAIVAKNPAAKSSFMVDGKNMTQLSTDKLVELLAKYNGQPAPVATEKAGKPIRVVAVEKTNVEKAAELVESIRTDMEDENSDKEDVCEDVMNNVEALAALVSGDTQHGTTGGSPVPTPKSIPAQPVESEKDKAVREEKERKAAKNKEMEAKAREMAKDFQGLGSF